ncbi:MAG: phage terminase large subunit family protein [Candidatus Eisenbacteria bacterium]
MGISEFLIVDAIRFADVCDGVVVYIFPAMTQLGDFVQERVHPPIQASPYLSYICRLSSVAKGERLAGTSPQKVGLQRVRNGYVYHRGATRRHLLTVDADMVTLDELDSIEDLEPLAESWADERLGHSKWKRKRSVSIPTYEDMGIDAKWKTGTQHEWFVLCEHCNTKQYLEWNKNVVITHPEDPELIDAEMVCESCRRPIDRLGPGDWIPAYPSRDIVSLHISKLFSSRVTMRELARASIDTGPGKQQLFWCSHMGETYKPLGDYVSDDMIKAAIGEYHISSGCDADTMGIDPGHRHHWWTSKVEGGVRRCMALGAVEKWEDIPGLIRQFTPDVCVIESLYEEGKCQAIAKQFPEIVVLADTSGQHAEAVKAPVDRQIDPGQPKPIRYVSVNRDIVYDGVIEKFAKRGGQIQLPIEAFGMKGGDPIFDLWKHLQGVKRIKETDLTTGDTVIHFKKTSMAHWFDACALDEVAMKLLRPKRRMKFGGAIIAKG